MGAMRYTLPDFTVGLGLNLFFIDLSERSPAWFQDGVVIDSVYGCFPGCVLNGGRAFIRDRFTPNQMEQALSLLAERGVKARLTLTNMLASEEDLEDGYLGEMLVLAARYGAEAIVYSDFVGDYVRDRFGMKRVLSTTRAIDDVDELNRMAKRYDYVVLNYNRNKDRAFIDAIEDNDGIEVMVNEFCAYRCPHRQAHYLHNSEDQKNGSMRPFECAASKADFFDHKPAHPVIFTDDEVRALHDETGIGYFKIVGRGVAFQTVLESYVYYLVKPPYRDEVKRLVMQAAR